MSQAISKMMGARNGRITLEDNAIMIYVTFPGKRANPTPSGHRKLKETDELMHQQEGHAPKKALGLGASSQL